MKMWEEAPQTEIFGIPVYTFGLYCLVGALCAVVCIRILCGELKMKKGTAWVLSCASIVFGLVFSRLGYCVVRLIGDLIGGGGVLPVSFWFRLNTGGWSLYGMIFGVFIAARVTAAITKEPKRRLLDIVSCALPLAMAAERAGERLFEVFNISRSIPDGQFPANTFLAVHDAVYGDNYIATYDYCAVAAVLLFLLLVVMLTRGRTQEGDVWIMFMILVGAGGAVLESLRYDSFMELSFVRIQQAAAAALLVWGVIAAGKRGSGDRKRLFTAAAVSLPVAIGAVIGIEFALDKTSLSHVLLYVLMFVFVAVPVALGLKLLLGGREKGKEAA